MRAWILLVPLAIVLGLACRSASKNGAVKEAVTASTPLGSDAELEKRVHLLDVRFVEVAGTRRVTFGLASVSGEPVELFFHVQWFDATNAPIADAPQLWYPVHLSSGERRDVTLVAPRPDATFRLLVQAPHAVR